MLDGERERRGFWGREGESDYEGELVSVYPLVFSAITSDGQPAAADKPVRTPHQRSIRDDSESLATKSDMHIAPSLSSGAEGPSILDSGDILPGEADCTSLA
jgi:hypothetical protein